MSSTRIIRSSIVSGRSMKSLGAVSHAWLACSLVAALSMAAFAAEPAKPAAPAAVAPTAAAAPATAPAATPATPAAAPAKAGGRSCDEVKAEIEAKIKAKGVKTFTLEVVSKDEVKDQKVVGNCEGGSKRITYKRG